jgi:hypothetical protein
MSTNEGFQNFNAGNFDANSLANLTSAVIMFALVADISTSIQSYEKPMSDALEDVFLNELKKSHRANDIVLSKLEFGYGVTPKFGYTPINDIQAGALAIRGTEGATALYEAVEAALKGAMAYREDLENQGIEVRTNICIITDGEDNASTPANLAGVNDLIGQLRKNEAWANTFTITLIGVGDQANFTNAVVKMGLDPAKSLVQISTSAHEIRKQMGVVSQSVSSSAGNNGIQF